MNSWTEMYQQEGETRQQMSDRLIFTRSEPVNEDERCALVDKQVRGATIATRRFMRMEGIVRESLEPFIAAQKANSRRFDDDNLLCFTPMRKIIAIKWRWITRNLRKGSQK